MTSKIDLSKNEKQKFVQSFRQFIYTFQSFYTLIWFIFQHVEMVLKWLATFHALGYAFVDQYEGGIEKMRRDFDIFFFKFLGTDDMKKLMGQFRDMSNKSHKALLEQVPSC